MQIYSKWKWWKKFREEKKLDDSYEKRKTKKLKRVDGKFMHNLQDSIYSLISALDTADIDNFQIVWKLLEIACVLSIEWQKQNKQLQALYDWKLLGKVLWQKKEKKT